jgi:hypothetical protein
MDYIELARSRQADEERRHRKRFRLKVIAWVYLGSVLLFGFLFFVAL